MWSSPWNVPLRLQPPLPWGTRRSTMQQIILVECLSHCALTASRADQPADPSNTLNEWSHHAASPLLSRHQEGAFCFFNGLGFGGWLSQSRRNWTAHRPHIFHLTAPINRSQNFVRFIFFAPLKYKVFLIETFSYLQHDSLVTCRFLVLNFLMILKKIKNYHQKIQN
jgi:hypothetical protein